MCKHTHTHTHKLSSLISVLLLAVKGPADVSALFMQIPFCSSVTMEYFSLFSYSLAPLHALRLLSLHLTNFLSPLFVQGNIRNVICTSPHSFLQEYIKTQAKRKGLKQQQAALLKHDSCHIYVPNIRLNHIGTHGVSGQSFASKSQ